MLIVCLVAFLIDCVVLFVLLAGYLLAWLVGCDGWLVVWLFGDWLVWLGGWLVAWVC